MNDNPKLCECGCGNYTRIADRTTTSKGIIKGQYNRFCYGHHGEINFTNESRQKISKTHKGIKKTKEHIEKQIKSKTGRDAIYSPFLPDTRIRYIKKKNELGRWYCQDPLTQKTNTHAKIVYKTLIGFIPEGMHVHHKNGEPSQVKNDNPNNLMLLSMIWNYRYFPLLCRIFKASSSIVTDLYIELSNKYKDEELFKEIFKRLLENDKSTA